MRAESRPEPAGERPQSALADHNTPLIANAWYIAALSGEVGRKMIERTILGRSVLLYRREDGSVTGLQNRCPHRSFPLSKGTLIGDVVRCGYHGISYASSGECVDVPSQETFPSSFRLQAYPIVERGPFVWIWPGDPAAVRSADIPTLPWLLDPNFAHVEGYAYVDASYVMLHENVLDMTHASFLHGDAAATIAYASVPPDVTIEEDTVSISRTARSTLAPPFYEAAMGRFGRRVDRATTSVFATPGVHFAHDVIVDLEASASERARFFFEYVHAFTPATQTSTHYFWSNARDSSVDDLRVSELTHKRSTAVYFEDAEATQWAQKLRLSESPAEISVRGDKAGIQMRRILQRLAAAASSTHA